MRALTTSNLLATIALPYSNGWSPAISGPSVSSGPGWHESGRRINRSVGRAGTDVSRARELGTPSKKASLLPSRHNREGFIAWRASRRMVGGIVGGAVTALGAVVVFAIGVFELAVCGSGLSLLLFGGAILLVGITIFPVGGPFIIASSGFIAFLLVVAGLVLGHGVAGCPY